MPGTACHQKDPVRKTKSVFYQHTTAVEKNLKSDWNWPLQPCYDMVGKLYAVTINVQISIYSQRFQRFFIISLKWKVIAIRQHQLPHPA